jgi:hypothetical protein
MPIMTSGMMTATASTKGGSPIPPTLFPEWLSLVSGKLVALLDGAEPSEVMIGVVKGLLFEYEYDGDI